MCFVFIYAYVQASVPYTTTKTALLLQQAIVVLISQMAVLVRWKILITVIHFTNVSQNFLLQISEIG